MHERCSERVFPHENPRTLLWLLTLCALVFAACSRSDPEREIRAAITRMAAGVEKHTPADLLEHVAEDFTRESATFGKTDLRRLLAGVLLRNEKITVTTVVSAVEVTGDRARTRLRVIATGGSGLLPERGQTWDVDVSWRREKGTWRVFNAEWNEGL